MTSPYAVILSKLYLYRIVNNSIYPNILQKSSEEINLDKVVLHFCLFLSLLGS